MAGTFLKWLIGGLVTVIGGTAIAITQTDGSATADLSNRAAMSLEAGDLAWAKVDIEGRDAILSGTATSQAMIDGATAALVGVRGIRAVQSDVRLAEFVSPFPFAAVLKDGTVTLSGGFPSDAVHAAIVAKAGNATDTTRLLSGAPDAGTFEAAAKFGLAALRQFDHGEVSLADLSLSIEGRAKSPAAFDELETLRQSVPPGVTIAALTVIPAVASPYVWSAKFDGASVTITGDTPTPDLADQLRAVAPANVPVSTTLTLASGEPSGFADTALTLLQTLLLLESGEVEINDGVISLSGAPATSDIAAQVTAQVTKLGGKATLAPPRIAEFTLSIDKTGDKLTFAGFVPDTATRDRLAALAGADVAKVSLGRGAPDRFESGVDFGLAALAHLGEGRFELKGTMLSLGGRAGTVADFKAALAIVAEGAPQGLTLAAAQLHPPVANPFTWSATKAESGQTTLSGFVPDEAIRSALHAKIANLATDTADPADGAPGNFARFAAKGLEVLALLDSGTLTFDGANWAIDGAVDSAKKGFAADVAYSEAGLRTAGWTYDVHLPKPAARPALPVIAPYVWRAQKSADGKLSFSGFVPAEAFQRVARSRAPNALDSTVLGAGAPPDFGTSALAGIDALMALDEGSLGLAGTHWTLTGGAGDAGAREAIQNRLSGGINPANWQIAIQAKGAAPVVTPYLWSAEKAADGSVILSGYVPDEALRTSATGQAGNVTRDTTVIASGEPAGFADDLSAGLDALSHLTNGRAAFDGSKWLLSGDIASDEQGAAALAALTAGSRQGALWTTTITGYPPPPPPSSEPSSSSEPSTEVSSAPDVVSLEPSSEMSASAEPSSEAYPSEPFMEPATESSSEPSSEQMQLSIESSSEPAQDREVAPTGLDAVVPVPDTLVFEASRARGAAIALKGAVPAAAAAAYFGGIAGDVPTDALTIATGLPMDFITNGIGGIDALTRLNEGRLGFDGARWWLRGKVETAAVRDAVAAGIAGLPKGADWSVAVDLLAPIDVCRDRVGALAGRNAILFQSGKATLIAASLPVLDELATDLAICPGTYVHVEGHTDADGAEELNLALSVSRAEAVVAALIERAVDEARLYAEGYGESEPIAPNDTKQGKQQNRRIAFTITEE